MVFQTTTPHENTSTCQQTRQPTNQSSARNQNTCTFHCKFFAYTRLLLHDCVVKPIDVGQQDHISCEIEAGPTIGRVTRCHARVARASEQVRAPNKRGSDLCCGSPPSPPPHHASTMHAPRVHRARALHPPCAQHARASLMRRACNATAA